MTPNDFARHQSEVEERYARIGAATPEHCAYGSIPNILDRLQQKYANHQTNDDDAYSLIAPSGYDTHSRNNQNNNNNSWNGNNKSYSPWDEIEESHDDSEPDIIMDTFTNTSLSPYGNNQNSFNVTPDLSAPTKRINYLELDDWITSLDDASLNRLTTAQLIQRLRSNGLDYKGMKHELIERWKKFKMGKPKTGVKLN